MFRKPIDSSMMKSLGYNPLTGDLEVEFTTGKVVTYEQVSQGEFKDMELAESKGRYLNAVIKRHPFK